MNASATPERSRSTRQLASLAEIARLVNASSDLGTMLDRIVLAICQHTMWDMSSIMSVDEAAGRTELMARFDPHYMDVPGAPRTWALASSPALKVMRTGKPVMIADAKNDTEYPFYRADAQARDYATVVIAPLPAKDVHGRPMVIAVQSKSPIAVDEEASEFLLTVSLLAAIAVEKARRLAEERALTNTMRRTVDSAGVLMRLVLSDSSASRVLEAVERLLGRPVLVTDRSAAALLASDETRAGPALAAARATVRGRLERSLQAWQGATVPEPTASAFRGHEHALDVDGETVGHLYILEDDEAADPLDQLLVQQVRFAAGVLLMRSVVRFKSAVASQAKVLEELALGSWRAEDDLRMRAASVGVQLGTPGWFAVVGLDGAEAADALARHHRAISFLVAQACPASAVVALRPTELLVWFAPVPRNGQPFDSHGPEARALGAQVARILGESAVVCFGERCVALRDYAAAWSACERVLGLALRFGRRGVVHESDFGADALVLAALPQDGVHAFQRRMLDRLVAFDARNGSDLVATIEAYLHHHGRLQRCADAMGIHVTTLRYRLERVRDLFDVDFDDADQRFGLQLALRMRALQRG